MTRIILGLVGMLILALMTIPASADTSVWEYI